MPSESRLNHPTAAQLQELLDKQAIYELLCRYCRGRDRLDLELILSCFHPDATGLWVGLTGLYDLPVDEYLAAEFDTWKKLAGTQHLITNFLCEVDGDVAQAETYQYSSAWGFPEGDQVHNITTSNRFIDRFERREGEWKIVRREFYRNFLRNDGDDFEFPSEANGWPKSSHDRSDPAYRALR